MTKKPDSPDGFEVLADKLKDRTEVDSAQHSKNLGAGDCPWRIIRYQRILDPEKVSYPISNFSYVHQKTFEKHLRYLTRDCRVVALPNLLRAIEEGASVPEKTVAITLDGGWVDTFTYAFPLINQYALTATIFLPTAFIGSDDFFWQDKVLFALLWLKEIGKPFPPFDFFPEEIKSLMLSTSPEGEITLPYISIVINGLLASKPDDRYIGLAVLYDTMKALKAPLPAEPAFSNWDEIREMARLNMSVGLMGHNHILFDQAQDDLISQEIQQAQDTLKEKLGRTSNLFAFPLGLFSAKALNVLYDLGYDYCFGAGDVSNIQHQNNQTQVLRRISMFEMNSNTNESFTARLWDLEDQKSSQAHD